MFLADFAQVSGSPTPHDAGREIWRELVEDRCGTYFSDGRFHVLENRILERMRILGELDRNRYYGRVSKDREEWSRLLALILNGDTSFFRHPDSFQALRQLVFPGLRPEAIWCAGCSTGEEVYSIASLALEFGLDPVRVLGSDLSEAALTRAVAGVYPTSRDIRGFHRTARGIEPGPALRSIVAFERLNLMDPASYPGSQDLIWCQNVLIYCRERSRMRIVAGFEKSLRPGGYLLLSPVDAMSVRPASLEPVRTGSVPLFRKR